MNNDSPTLPLLDKGFSNSKTDINKQKPCRAGVSKVSPEQRRRVQMSPEAQNDI
jgi:hypothetical protein